MHIPPPTSTTTPSYAGQFIRNRANAGFEAKEKGEEFSHMKFGMAIPGTKAAASGANPVFQEAGPDTLSELHKYDKNQDGLIEGREAAGLLRDNSVSVGRNSNEQGQVPTRSFESLEEMEEFLEGLFDGIFSKEETVALYERFDQDGDGRVSASEAQKALEEIGAEAKKRIEGLADLEKEKVTISTQVEVSSPDAELKSTLRELRQG